MSVQQDLAYTFFLHLLAYHTSWRETKKGRAWTTHLLRTPLHCLKMSPLSSDLPYFFFLILSPQFHVLVQLAVITSALLTTKEGQNTSLMEYNQIKVQLVTYHCTHQFIPLAHPFSSPLSRPLFLLPSHSLSNNQKKTPFANRGVKIHSGPSLYLSLSVLSPIHLFLLHISSRHPYPDPYLFPVPFAF